MSTGMLAVELVVAATVYAWLVVALPDRGGREVWWFLAGVGALAVALVSPVHGWSERSLAGHMVQHVVLVAVAAPLLAAARPLRALTERFGMVRSGSDREIATTAVAAVAVMQAAVLLGWHVPVLFDAAVAHPLLHEAEHATLLMSAFVMWTLLLRAATGSAVVVLFVVTLPAMAYGVALTLADDTWYAPYPRLADQQLAGVVMWAYGGLLAVLGGVALGVDWLRRAERHSPGWQRTIGGAR